MKQGSGDKSEKVLRSKRAKHVQRDRALNQFLLAGIPDPLLTVSWIWYATSVKSINEQVALTAKNQLIQLKYSLENNFLQLNYLTQKMTDDHQLSLNF